MREVRRLRNRTCFVVKDLAEARLSDETLTHMQDSCRGRTNVSMRVIELSPEKPVTYVFPPQPVGDDHARPCG